MEHLEALETPALILDRGKTQANMQQMADILGGLPLRAHGKTAKSLDVLRLMPGGLPGKITASTLKEAEYFFEGGIADIIYGVGLAPVKLPRIAKLIKRGANLACTVDNPAQVIAAARHARDRGIVIPLYLEVDTDGHRSGIAPGSAALVDLARRIDREPGLDLRGVLTHAGESYACTTTDQIREIADQESRRAIQCADQIRAAGLPCPEVSVGSTPTARFRSQVDGVTEVRAGVYQFQDLVMANIGVCELSEIAVSVLCTVIGHQTEKHWIITDGGWMALSRDRGTANQATDYGYGQVCDVHGRPLGDLIVSAANQEHGIITSRTGLAVDLDAFPVGTPLRILPNHACATATMFERYMVVDGSTALVAEWPRMGGW
jgi:D-serine deaminase-like pyridoxal phosphate-dependent protein